MDDSFNQQSNEKLMMKKEYSSKIEGNKFSISALRKQIDEQRILLLEKKMELVEVTNEFEETQDSTNEGGNEQMQLESELVMHQRQNELLITSKKQLEGELYSLRELNSNDICEINKLNYELDQSSKGANEMQIEEQSQEQLIQVQATKYEGMNNKLDQKMAELDEKAFQLEECEGEIFQFETQVDSFKSELVHLQNIEQKYIQENDDLHFRIQEETQKNMDLEKSINSIETKVTKLESKLTFLKSKADSKSRSKNTQQE